MAHESTTPSAGFSLIAPAIWVNRTDILVALGAQARAPGPTRVLLHGLPGSGKTALAATWFAGPDAPRGRVRLVAALQPGGAHPVTVHEVLAEWLRVLGVAPEHIPPGLAQRSAAFRRSIQNVPAVVLIDNATSAEDVRALTPSGDFSTVVATSTLRLGELVIDGFGLYAVAELPLDDSATLLSAYQPRTRPPASKSVLRRIAEYCAGHPQTLCVAAAFLAMHQHTTPVDLEAILARRPAETLTVGGPCLGDLLNLAYDNLPQRAQQLYRLLSDHPGHDFTVDAVAVVLDQPFNVVEDAMHRLFHAHLVTETGPGRYALDISVRQHARRLRGEVDGSALRDEQRRKLITWYVDRTAGAADTIKPSARRYTRVFTERRAARHLHTSAAHAQEWFSCERRNIMAALNAAAELRMDDLLVEIAEAVWDPLRTGYHLEDIVVSQGLGTTSLDVSDALDAVMTARTAFALTSLEEHDDAITAANKAVDLAQDTDDSWAQAMTLSTRARALTEAGHTEDAIPDLEAALALDRQCGDQRSIALRLRRLGQAHLALDHPVLAVQLLQRSVTDMEAADDPAGRARSLTYLATAYLAAGYPGRALDTIQRTDGYFEAAGSTRHLVDAKLVVARALQQAGNAEAADAACTDLLELLAGESGSRADACRAEVQAIQERLG